MVSYGNKKQLSGARRFFSRACSGVIACLTFGDFVVGNHVVYDGVWESRTTLIWHCGFRLIGCFFGPLSRGNCSISQNTPRIKLLKDDHVAGQNPIAGGSSKKEDKKKAKEAEKKAHT